MGNAKIRKSKKQRGIGLPHDQWRDLVVFTALLLGAEFERVSSHQWHVTHTTHYYGWRNQYYGFKHRWQAARSWLWSVHHMSVCPDGSIYHQTVEKIMEELDEREDT